ncbi:MAG: Na/Pi cotransporter family protein [Mobilicoccus sp.]|nr:Na/Pi cotransporter family protein [Mobilicoccus sp.]
MPPASTPDASKDPNEDDEARSNVATDDDEDAPARGEDSDKAPSSPLSFLPFEGTTQKVVEWVAIFVAIWVLITAVSSIGGGFDMAVGDEAEELFQFAANPFVGLVVGLLATVLTQSSSTTTAITVGMVAGGLPIEIAIPILFGANMGTTMTSTLVSLGMARDKETFRRAFGAASVHDMYNLTALVIFFPLELIFGVLGHVSKYIADTFAGEDAGVLGTAFTALGDGVSFLTDPGADLLESLVEPLGDVWGGVALIFIGIGLILLTIGFIGTLMKSLLVGKAEKVLHGAIGRGPISGVGAGTLITVMVQSSTTVTSLCVPLAGSGKFKVKEIYPLTVGANIGTTLTALIAAFGFSGVEGQAALQAAAVHMMYNVLAATLILSIPFLRYVPVKMALWLADLGAENKLYVVAWVLGVFAILPASLIALSVFVF